MTKKDLLMSVDLSSRGKRRKAITLVIGLLMEIRAGEQTLMLQMPLNLQGSVVFETAEYAIDIIDEAIDIISSVYD
jgi:hypothetical protein